MVFLMFHPIIQQEDNNSCHYLVICTFHTRRLFNPTGNATFHFWSKIWYENWLTLIVHIQNQNKIDITANRINPTNNIDPKDHKRAIPPFPEIMADRLMLSQSESRGCIRCQPNYYLFACMIYLWHQFIIFDIFQLLCLFRCLFGTLEQCSLISRHACRYWIVDVGTCTHQVLAATVTLFQPGRADYAHHMLMSTPSF